MTAVSPQQKGGDGVGKTKKGKGTKWELIVEKNGTPLSFVLDSAQLHELKLAPQVLESVSIPQGRGRPRKRPHRTVADRGYDCEGFRQSLRRARIRPCIPKRK